MSSALEVSHEFLLPRSASELEPINNYSPFNSNLLQVPCNRGANGLQFGNGSQRYQFSVSPQQRCALNEGYFRIRMSLYASCPTGQGGNAYNAWRWGAPLKSYAKVPSFDDAQPPTIASYNDIAGHDITFAENCCANLFSQINVKINNIMISQVQIYLPQIDMLVQRLTTSYTAQRANRYANLMGMSLRERIDYVSANSTVFNGATFAGGYPSGLIRQGVASSAVAGNNPFILGTDTILLSPSTSSTAIASVPNTGANTGTHIEFLWKPTACSAFNVDKYLPAGQYEIELVPANSWYLQCLESIRHIQSSQVYVADSFAVPAQAPTYNTYGVAVDDIQFFVPLVASPQYLDDLSFYLSLNEYEIQVKPLVANNANTFVYTIPWSTQCICVALQSNFVGQTTLMPPSKFTNLRLNGQNAVLDANSIIDINSNDIQNIQITYGKVYPQNNYNTVMNPVVGRQNIYQRYYDTFSNSKALWDSGCQEPFSDNTYAITCFTPYQQADVRTTRAFCIPTYGFNNADFLSRGAIYCVSVAKPQESKITQCTLVVQYNVNAPAYNDNNSLVGGGLAQNGLPNILLMSAYKKTLKVTIANSVAVAVEIAEG